MCQCHFSIEHRTHLQYEVWCYINIYSSNQETVVTFFIALSMKSTASNCPAFWANSAVNLPIPAPSSKTDFPSYDGNRESTYT